MTMPVNDRSTAFAQQNQTWNIPKKIKVDNNDNDNNNYNDCNNKEEGEKIDFEANNQWR